MSQTLKIANFSSNNVLAQTNLQTDVAAGDTSLKVGNSVNFQPTTIVLIGNRGGDSTEIQRSQTIPDGSTITLVAPAKQDHNFNETLSALFGSHIKLYSSPDRYNTGQQPPDADFSLVAGSPFPINPTTNETMFTDAAGVPGTWYRYTYYDPSSSSETLLTDSIPVQAGAMHYVSLDRIRNAAGFTNNPNVGDDVIAQFRDAAEKEVNGTLLPVYQLPLPQPTNPIITEIVKEIAAGELMAEMYTNVNSDRVEKGKRRARAARHGDDNSESGLTSLDDLSYRVVVLTDAHFNEQTIDEGHAFGGWPDETTSVTPANQGGDCGHQFDTEEIY